MIKSIALGDSHNFGRRVSLIEDDGQRLIEKPRCVFWEHLFLNPNSIFRIFLRTRQAEIDFDAVLGEVNIDSFDNFQSGRANFIVDEEISDLEKWLEGYGALIGVSSVFGITDLHKENVFTVNNSPQIIDIECIFWDLNLPSESFLLPKNGFEWSKSVWNPTGVKGLNSLKPEQVELILNSYTKVVDFFLLHHQTLSGFFESLKLGEFPIRILLEKTRNYISQMSNGLRIQELIAEEIEQMERLDIPYFFGFAGDHRIYCFSPDNTAREVHNRKPIITSKLTKAFRSPHILLSPERLNRISRQGIAEIVARLMDKELIPFSSEQLKVKVADGYLRIAFKGKYLLQIKDERAQ